MYKKQMIVQKVLCMAALCSSVLVFLYALGIMTDLYDTLYSTMMNSSDLTDTDVPGSIVYYNMQGFNAEFLKYSIVMILLGCLLFVTNTHIRRRYYIGNFISIAAYALFSFNTAFYCHGYIEAYKAQFLKVDFAALKEHAETWKTAYTESTFWFDIHYCIFAISIIVSIVLICNAIWKVSLMKEEEKLIEAGKGATV